MKVLFKKLSQKVTAFFSLCTLLLNSEMYIHTYTHIHTYIHIHTYLYTHTYTYIHTHIYIGLHTYIHQYIHVSVAEWLVWLTSNCGRIGAIGSSPSNGLRPNMWGQKGFNPLCQCVYIYVCIVKPDIQTIHRCSHTSIHTYTHIYIYIHTNIHTYTQTYSHNHSLTHTDIYKMLHITL